MQYFNNLFKSFFTLGKSEQKGIFILFAIIFLLSIINLFFTDIFKSNPEDFNEFKTQVNIFEHQQQGLKDSINLLKKQKDGNLTLEEAKKIIHPFNFNPNTLDKFSYLEMGFSNKQYRTIKKYLDKGGRFRSKEDFRDIYCISDAEFKVVEPFLVIENEVVEKREVVKNQSLKNTVPKPQPKYVLTEINSADSSLLFDNLALKPYLINRMIKYRSLLGGYYCPDQLKEVYGFPEYYFEKIKPWLAADTAEIIRIYINEVKFKELLRHPYFTYETTRLIFNNKPKKGYTDFSDLLKKTSINDSIAEKIKHYLYFGAPK